MTAKTPARPMAAIFILGCFAAPAFAEESVSDASQAAVPYTDDQFETSLAADFQAWWRHYAPVAAAQTSPASAAQPVSTSSDAAPAAYAADQTLKIDIAVRDQLLDRFREVRKDMIDELREQRTMLIDQGKRIGKLESLLQFDARVRMPDSDRALQSEAAE